MHTVCNHFQASPPYDITVPQRTIHDGITYAIAIDGTGKNQHSVLNIWDATVLALLKIKKKRSQIYHDRIFKLKSECGGNKRKRHKMHT